MKKAYFILIVFINQLLTFAQIPNPSFELWTGNQPNGWRSYSNPPTTPYTCETASNNAYIGTSALRSDVVYPGTPTLALESGIVTGSSSANSYIPISTKPSKLFGWYILNCWNDTFSVNIWLKSAGIVIGSGIFQTKFSTSTYTQFTVNITYTSVAVPDSCKIDISFNQPGPSIIPSTSFGEYFIIDNLYFDINAGLESSSIDYKPLTLFPNPATQSINISTIGNGFQKTEIEIINSIGERILKTSDTNNINVSQLLSGYYLIRVTASERQQFYARFVKE